MSEQTGRQILTTVGFNSSVFGYGQLPASYATYRRMRKDPTLAMVRTLSVAPIVAAEWSVEADDDVSVEVVKWVQDQFMAIRDEFMETALLAGIDYGHQCFEQVVEYDCETGWVKLKRLKPLLHDFTSILIDEYGEVTGVENNGVTLDRKDCVVISFRVEGTNWYGYPLLENARDSHRQWNEANSGAERYDTKIAGSHWVVYYPLGESLDQSGNTVDNAILAQRILAALESSGSVAVPRDVAAFADELNKANSGWEITILSDSSGRQPTFIERLKYLDTLKVRALLMPERAVTEGQFGTKAEAEAHGDLSMVHADLLHRHVTRSVNRDVLDPLLAINFGRSMRGKVRLVAAPIADEQKAFLQSVYTAILANAQGFLQESTTIDTDALKDVLGVPKGTEVAEGGVGGMDSTDPLAATVRGIYASLR